jgi:hypothetical protein
MDKMVIFTSYFFLRLLINSISMILLVRIVYYKTYQKKDSFFTFFLLNFIVFLLAFMLEKTGGFNSIGSAFGLLAAFSLLRFRTETISLKDMTYLFIIMAIGLINSVMKGTYFEIIGLNVLIIMVVYIVDGNTLMRTEQHKTIEYFSLQKIRPDQEGELIADLRERTGLNIQKITIEHIDFAREKATIRIYFY